MVWVCVIYFGVMMKIVPVILSGGVGSRLWPVSRSVRPKPFMWAEKSGSLLANTFRRIHGLNDTITDMVSVSNEKYRFAVQNVVSDMDFTCHNILEPFGKNTAGAVGVACAYVRQHFGGDAVVVVLPSDHIIQDINRFHSCIESAVKIAADGYLVSLGVVPTRPHTGYGYIKRGAGVSDGYTVAQFVEKPDFATAEMYVTSGDYFWNAGMFVFGVRAYLQQLAQHAPDVAAVVDKVDVVDKDFVIDADVFATMPDISIDYAVMEKSDKLVVVAADFDWNDLGAWDSVAETLPIDANNNRVRDVSDVVMYDTHNTNIFTTSEDKLIATVGLDNVTIVETRDAVLVAKNNKLQGVKDIVNTLTKNKHPSAEVHRTEYRPWGTFTILDEGDTYKVKQILVYPGQKLSLQSHNHRSEHWVVVMGVATVDNGDETVTLNANESIYIPQGNRHRLCNHTDSPVVIIEVQTGDYLGEDDIIRYEDTYGRF